MKKKFFKKHDLINFLFLVCSVDTRDSDFGVAEQWSGGEILGQRATFRADRHPAALILTNVKAKDEALYRCRVDFRLAQTRNAHVNLTVIGKGLLLYFNILAIAYFTSIIGMSNYYRLLRLY